MAEVVAEAVAEAGAEAVAEAGAEAEKEAVAEALAEAVKEAVAGFRSDESTNKGSGCRVSYMFGTSPLDYFLVPIARTIAGCFDVP